MPEGRLDLRNHNLVGLGMTSSEREADVGDEGEERGKGSTQEQLAVGGNVYMVATPIGNMQDMTSRAVGGHCHLLNTSPTYATRQISHGHQAEPSRIPLACASVSPSATSMSTYLRLCVCLYLFACAFVRRSAY
jgi:hypothetical protein